MSNTTPLLKPADKLLFEINRFIKDEKNIDTELSNVIISITGKLYKHKKKQVG